VIVFAIFFPHTRSVQYNSRRPRINLLSADFSSSCALHRDTYLRLLCLTRASRICTVLRDFHQIVFSKIGWWVRSQ